jgi:hypothetical protein
MICSYRESDYENINSNEEDSLQFPYDKAASGDEIEEDNVDITKLTDCKRLRCADIITTTMTEWLVCSASSTYMCILGGL